MNSLTKKHRLLWEPDKTIIGDPFKEQLSSTTLINTSNYFESDNVGDIQPKIDELGLILMPEDTPYEFETPPLAPDPIVPDE